MQRLLSKLLVLCFVLVPITGLKAQLADPEFAKYLTQKNNYQGVLDLALFDPGKLSSGAQDSLNFYTGWSHFHLQQVPEAIAFFNKVSAASPFNSQSRILASWCNLYEHDLSKARESLFKSNQELYYNNQAFKLQEVAILLSEKDLNSSDAALKKLEENPGVYSEQIRKLRGIYATRSEYKEKSEVKAALLSAILPGSGKYYAGDRFNGISSMLTMGVLAGITAESIWRSGWLSWNSVLSAGLFGIFYFENIYGSTVSVKTYRDKFNEDYHQAILATVIIPIRDYYR